MTLKLNTDLIPPTSGQPEEFSPVEDSAPEGGTPRKRGGQRGNTNALKHGFYSHWFTQVEKRRLDRNMLGQLADEEKGLSIVIDRIFAAVEAGKIPDEKILEISRAVSLAVGRIESIHRSRKAIYDRETTIEKALDELKYIPVDED